MPRRLAPIAAVMLAAFCFTGPLQASDTCGRATGGKCKIGQTAPPKKSNRGAVTHQATQPTPKGNHKGRSEYTAAQRDKFMEQARQLCKRKYGAPSRVYSIDYKKNLVYCEPPSY